jgi:hypothetical protein
MQSPHSRQVFAFSTAPPTISRARSGVKRFTLLLADRTALMAMP